MSDLIDRQAVLDESWPLEYPDGSTEMVISANDIVNLPPVHAEPCSDTISRQVAIDAFCQICMDKNICYRNKENCEDLFLFRQKMEDNHDNT